MIERPLTLDIGEKRFHIGFSWRGVCFLWEADTSAPNLVWMKSIAVWLNWPPVEWETAYYDREYFAAREVIHEHLGPQV